MAEVNLQGQAPAMFLNAEQPGGIEQGKPLRYPSPDYPHLCLSHHIRVELPQVHGLIWMPECKVTRGDWCVRRLSQKEMSYTAAGTCTCSSAQLFEWLCRTFSSNNLCGISVSDDGNRKPAMSEKMNICLCVVIRYLCLKGLSPKELMSSPCWKKGHLP